MTKERNLILTQQTMSAIRNIGLMVGGPQVLLLLIGTILDGPRNRAVSVELPGVDGQIPSRRRHGSPHSLPRHIHRQKLSDNRRGGGRGQRSAAAGPSLAHRRAVLDNILIDTLQVNRGRHSHNADVGHILRTRLLPDTHGAADHARPSLRHDGNSKGLSGSRRARGRLAHRTSPQRDYLTRAFPHRWGKAGSFHFLRQSAIMVKTQMESDRGHDIERSIRQGS